MITPEFIADASGEFIFVANHNLEREESVARSVAFNLGRIALAREHLPPSIGRCVITYDIRGQRVSVPSMERVRSELGTHCVVRFVQS